MVVWGEEKAELIVPLDMKGCICHFVKCQIHPFISKLAYVVWYNKQTQLINCHSLIDANYYGYFLQIWQQKSLPIQTKIQLYN